MSNASIFVLAGLSAALGCDAPASFASATPAEAVSVEHPTATESRSAEVGYRAASIDVPSAIPARSLELGSRGVVRLVPDDGARIPVLHVSLALAALDLEVPWTIAVDTAQITIDDAQLGVIAASSDRETLPIAIIPGGERHAVELYFPMPGELGVGAPLRFDFSVRGSTSAGTFDVTASFVRGTDAPSIALRPLGEARHWWFAATYAWPQFRDEDGIITSRPPTRVVILDDTRTSSSSESDADGDDCAEW